MKRLCMLCLIGFFCTLPLLAGTLLLLCSTIMSVEAAENISPGHLGATILSKQGMLSTNQFSRSVTDSNVYSAVVLPAPDETWLMFYTAYAKVDATSSVAIATSTDLITWSKPNLGQVTYDGHTSNNLIIATGFYILCDVVIEEGLYVLLMNNVGNHGALLYSSTDGTTWDIAQPECTFLGKVWDIDSVGTWTNFAEPKGILKTEDGKYRIYYSSGHSANLRTIGYYESSASITNDPAGFAATFTDQGNIPTLTAPDANNQFYDMSMFRYDGDVWSAIPRYSSSSPFDLLGPLELWRSQDEGLTWTYQGKLVDWGSTGTFDSLFLATGKPFLVDEKWHLFYVGSDTRHFSGNLNLRFGLATGGWPVHPDRTRLWMGSP